MDTGRGDDGLPFGDIGFGGVEVGHDEHFDGVACRGFGEFGLAGDVVAGGGDVFFEEGAEVGVCIGEPMGDVHFVVFIHDLEIEAESISWIWLTSRRIIRNIGTPSIPPPSCLLILPPRKEQHLHPLIIMTVILTEICNVKPIGHPHSCIRKPEEEPLGIPLGVIVRSHVQLILEFTHFEGSFEVAGLEAGLKDEGCVGRVCEGVVGVQV